MAEDKKCLECGTELSKRQKMFCSNKCKLSNKDNIAIRTKAKDKQDDGLIAVCKSTGKVYKDHKNYSGVLTRHVRSMGHEMTSVADYFDVILNPKSPKPKYHCKYCQWSTVDVKNLSGCITSHLKKEHSIETSDHVIKYPDESILFSHNNKDSNRQAVFNTREASYTTCEICKKRYEKLTETHMNTHGITLIQYRDKYPNSKTLSKDQVDIHRKQYELNRVAINKIKKVSNKENELRDFLKSLGVSYKQSDRTVINPMELDFYIADHKLAIEYNGLAWHSEKFGKKDKWYHLSKLEKCEEAGVRLITIFEDDWINKKDIVKNKIVNALRLNKDRIYARKCVVSEINLSDKNNFLDIHHIQAKDTSPICLGLHYNGVLVSVMTFGRPKITMGDKGKLNGSYELSRFASSTNVVGAASKLLSYFIKTYSPKSIFSFADRRYTTTLGETVYDKIGFKKDKINPPTYWVLKNHRQRYHRFTFNKKRIVKYLGGDPKKTEIQNLYDLGYDRIWDCGAIKYVMTLT